MHTDTRTASDQQSHHSAPPSSTSPTLPTCNSPPRTPRAQTSSPEHILVTILWGQTIVIALLAIVICCTFTVHVDRNVATTHQRMETPTNMFFHDLERTMSKQFTELEGRLVRNMDKRFEASFYDLEVKISQPYAELKGGLFRSMNSRFETGFHDLEEKISIRFTELDGSFRHLEERMERVLEQLEELKDKISDLQLNKRGQDDGTKESGALKKNQVAGLVNGALILRLLLGVLGIVIFVYILHHGF